MHRTRDDDIGPRILRPSVPGGASAAGHAESFRFGDLRFTNFEMEGSAIASLARKLGHEGATVCLAIAHRYAKQANADYKSLMGGLVKMCLDRLAQ